MHIILRSAHRPLVVLVLFLTTAFGPGLSVGQPLSQGQGSLRVMTQNADEGTDFQAFLAATDPLSFSIAVGQTLSEVQATRPAERMRAVASQIAVAAPAVVSLQELDRLSVGSFDPVNHQCGALSVSVDMLSALMAALASAGASYEVALLAPALDLPPVPGVALTGQPICVQLASNNAILARTDLGPTHLRLTNPQTGQFHNIPVLSTPLGPLALGRSWLSVDVLFYGQQFRFIGTHLEALDPGLRRLQGAELRAIAASSPVAVVIAMDSNAQADPPLDTAYSDFIASGYRDAWAQVHPGVAGNTCCQAPTVDNSASQLSTRIDLVLLRGGVEAVNAALFGADTASKTPSGLWPSDHAGLAAQLAIDAP